MDGFGTDFSLAFASLVAIINPLGLAFVFRRLTIWATPSERAKLSTRIALYAVAVILGSYFFGRFVLGSSGSRCQRCASRAASLSRSAAGSF
jgi:multiple antibiotic resistance protein